MKKIICDKCGVECKAREFRSSFTEKGETILCLSCLDKLIIELVSNRKGEK